MKRWLYAFDGWFDLLPHWGTHILQGWVVDKALCQPDFTRQPDVIIELAYFNLLFGWKYILDITVLERIDQPKEIS